MPEADVVLVLSQLVASVSRPSVNSTKPYLYFTSLETHHLPPPIRPQKLSEHQRTRPRSSSDPTSPRASWFSVLLTSSRGGCCFGFMAGNGFTGVGRVVLAGSWREGEEDARLRGPRDLYHLPCWLLVQPLVVGCAVNSSITSPTSDLFHRPKSFWKKKTDLCDADFILSIPSFNDTFVHITDLSGKETISRVTGGMKVKADRDESSVGVCVFVLRGRYDVAYASTPCHSAIRCHVGRSGCCWQVQGGRYHRSPHQG